MKGCNHVVIFDNAYEETLEIKYVTSLCPDCQEKQQEKIEQLERFAEHTPNVKYFLALQHAHKKINEKYQGSLKLVRMQQLLRLFCENWLQFVSSAECKHCHGDCLWDSGMSCECQWSKPHG